jgi:2-polyprenyl-3-methyl-5-hydroxy-6-metoxy-1,4-benzoquinol methylase
MKPLKIRPGHYDVIVAGDIIEHLENLGIALLNLKKVMSPETILIVTTPNCYCYFNIANIFRKKENVHKDHFFWPSRQTMKQLFEHLGFRIRFFRYVNFGSYSDIKTIKGKLFYHLFLRNIGKIRSTLFFVISIK